MQFFSGIWCWVFALLTASAYAAGLYYKNKKDELAKGWRLVLAAVRFGFVFLICLLFFFPLIKIKRERIEKPLCFLVLDQSSSMRGAADSAFLVQNFNQLAQSLSEKFEVRKLGFGQDATANPDFTFNASATDFSKAFKLIRQQNPNNEPAVTVLFSDGNNNIGQEPVSAYRNLAFPIYTVGFGDTNLYPDLFIGQVLVNRYAYKGSTFPVHIRLGQKRAPQAASRLRLEDAGGRILKDTLIAFEGKREQSVEWNIETQDSGICRYTLRLGSLQDEYDLQNNRRVFSVQVLENRQKILVLAHAPHPDLGCLRQSLQQQEKYSTDIVLAKDLADLAKNPARMESYDLVILHGLPSSRYPLREIKPLLEKKNLFYMLTASTSWPLFNQAEAGITIQPRGNRWNEAQAHFNAGFSLFNVSAQDKALWENFPPLQTPFALFNPISGGQSLFTQSILQVPTADPLLWISPPGNRRTALCCGTQLWKWRLANYQEKENTESFDLLLDKCLQLLCSAKPESNLNLHCPQTLRTTERLTVTAFLYNASFEKVENAPISFSLSRKDAQTEYAFEFVPENDHYTLDAGFLPEGEYRYTAQASVGGETYRSYGFLTVSDPQLENPKQAADHALLRNLALTYQGEFFYAGKSAQENPGFRKKIEQTLLHRQDLAPRLKSEENYFSPLHRQDLLIILLLLLSLEYFARKRFGNL